MIIINKNILAVSHIISKNPVLNESDDMKKSYLEYLKKYINLGRWNKRKYIRSQMNVYNHFLETNDTTQKIDIKKYKFHLILDLFHIIGYDEKLTVSKSMKRILNEYYADFSMSAEEKQAVREIISCRRKRKKISVLDKKAQDYAELVEYNINFLQSQSFDILITANMSAGKSMFVNAIAGKSISLSQNMACTSKIHIIIGKAYEDGYSAEDDHDLVLMAGKEELMNDNELNKSDNIIVSTYLDGGLGGKRIKIKDSPGVNFSENNEHKQLTEKNIRAKKYDLLIYLMNATQLGTNDEKQHLEFVRQNIGKKRIIFVINKIDALNCEDEDVNKIIENQAEYLKSIGFKNPIICPVSSRAAFLAKKMLHEDVGRMEKREFYSYSDKFEHMNLSGYYENPLKNISISDSDNEEEQLLKNCGFAYIEKIINLMYKGENVNGAGICKI